MSKGNNRRKKDSGVCNQGRRMLAKKKSDSIYAKKQWDLKK